MYYTGLDPRTMKEVYVPRSPHEKAMQRALIQYRNPKNYVLVAEALRKANRPDLIGFDKKCLIRPRQFSKEKQWVDREKKLRSGNSTKGGSNHKARGHKGKPQTVGNVKQSRKSGSLSTVKGKRSSTLKNR